MIWVTIDIEEATDMNFNVKWHDQPIIDYEKNIENFIKLRGNFKTTAFVLGTFAKKYPNIIKKISNNNIEIACHGMYHNLVYKEDFKNWKEGIKEAKDILENITEKEVVGYRSPSWSMPFKKMYYEELVKLGFKYSSSYFPMKNYMYGNSINKKRAFKIYTDQGLIEERPIAKFFIPYSGGFYLRVLPLWILKILFKKNQNSILYIHPYELSDQNLLKFFSNYASLNIDFLLAFISIGYPKKKIKSILKNE